ncbi:MAG: ABC transporter substrate-binding protein [Propionibacteriaceae bacterium]|nr:ABC transporter substrate-binding protein [Propionibacteriaceae bacterium]
MKRIVARLVAAALLLTGCTTTTTPPPAPPAPPAPPTAPPAQDPSGDLAVRACAPEGLLLPAAALDSCGLRITEAVNARLTRIDPATGQPELDLAEAIDTADSLTFTVRLARGRLFHDGTEVKARNIVSAWNWAAYGPHQIPAQSWFSIIDGGAAMTCPAEGTCSKDVLPTELAGLRILDDYSFTIRTVSPVGDLRARLAHPAFSPLPDAFFAMDDEGRETFTLEPIGSGPFRIAGITPTETTLAAFEDYTGTPRPRVQNVTLRRYDAPEQGLDAFRAYNDVVANTLDYTEVIPTDQLVDDLWQRDLPERHGTWDTRSVQVLNFIAGDSHLTDPRIRRAISMAIDRQALARQVFAGTREPATSWVSPAVPDYPADACGELCAYDLAEARALFTEAGGYPEVFRITVNEDGGHKQWADALCNQLKNTLELDCQVNLLDNQAQVLEALARGELTGMVRQGSPVEAVSTGALSAETALGAYASDSGRNRVGYRNPEFDARFNAARDVTTREGALEAYHAAELLLREDPPSVPLWFASTPYGYSTRISDVRLSPFGNLDLTAVRRS